MHFGIILGAFWGNFGSILGAFCALGVLLGVQEDPKRAPRAPKSVKILILKRFNNLEELPESSLSALRASKIALGRSGSGPGAKKEAKLMNLGIILGCILGSFWGSKIIIGKR